MFYPQIKAISQQVASRCSDNQINLAAKRENPISTLLECTVSGLYMIYSADTIIVSSTATSSLHPMIGPTYYLLSLASDYRLRIIVVDTTTLRLIDCVFKLASSVYHFTLSLLKTTVRIE